MWRIWKEEVECGRSELHKTSGIGVIDAFLLDSGKGIGAIFQFAALSRHREAMEEQL